MEVENNNILRRFEFIEHAQWIHISSPMLENGLNTFKEKRFFYRSFKHLEKRLTKSWSARTNITNAKMIRILSKLGASPWYIDLSQDKMYFFKRKNDASTHKNSH